MIAMKCSKCGKVSYTTVEDRVGEICKEPEFGKGGSLKFCDGILERVEMTDEDKVISAVFL